MPSVAMLSFIMLNVTYKPYMLSCWVSLCWVAECRGANSTPYFANTVSYKCNVFIKLTTGQLWLDTFAGQADNVKRIVAFIFLQNVALNY